MQSSRNRRLLFALIFVAALLLLGVYLKRAASAPKVVASFLSYTNDVNDPRHLQFVVVTFVNRERVPIKWHGMYVEEAGNPYHHAPTFNPNLSWITRTTLESGDSEVVAVGKPLEQARWRVCRDYSPVGTTNNYTATSKWFKP